MRALIARLRSDRGTTVAELAVTSMLAALFLGALGTFAMGSFKTGAFTEGQSATLDDVRTVMHKMEKEIRGSDSINWCSPAGSCVEVGALTATEGFKTIRYTHTSSELFRAEFDPDTNTFGEPMTMIERLTNNAAQPVFACDTQSSLLRVNIDLYIEPTPQSNPNLHVQTSIRPRNFPSVATCPTS
jgi:hypothetical protein